MPADSMPNVYSGSGRFRLRVRIAEAMAFLSTRPRGTRAPKSSIHLDRLDNLVQIVRHLHRAVRECGAANPSMPEDVVEGLAVGAVIRDGRRRVLELMPRQYAHDAVRRRDD